MRFILPDFIDNIKWHKIAKLHDLEGVYVFRDDAPGVDGELTDDSL